MFACWHLLLLRTHLGWQIYYLILIKRLSWVHFGHIFLSTYALTYLIPMATLWGQQLLWLSPFYRWGNWSSEKLNNFPKVIEVLNYRAMAQIRWTVSWIHAFNHSAVLILYVILWVIISLKTKCKQTKLLSNRNENRKGKNE